MSEKETIINYGILASIAWNSNGWRDRPLEKDLEKSNYGYVKDMRKMYESLNFAHTMLPLEKEGYYIGFTPMFMKVPSREKSKNVQIVFFFSTDYNTSNQKKIIGFYGKPDFGQWYDRKAKHDLFKEYDKGNIKAYPENIVYLNTPIIINNEGVAQKNLLPTGKKIGQQGFNYLNSDNVSNLLEQAIALNADNKELKRFVIGFLNLDELTNEELDQRDYNEIVKNNSADTLQDIEELEMKMKDMRPTVKSKVSSYIERGAISKIVKEYCHYTCAVCEALGVPTNSFVKSNGKPYIETHHVVPVSKLNPGVLGVTNLMTVCANHHRQLHYGNVQSPVTSDKQFIFIIDGREVVIDKIVLDKMR